MVNLDFLTQVKSITVDGFWVVINISMSRFSIASDGSDGGINAVVKINTGSTLRKTMGGQTLAFTEYDFYPHQIASPGGATFYAGNTSLVNAFQGAGFVSVFQSEADRAAFEALFPPGDPQNIINFFGPPGHTFYHYPYWRTALVDVDVPNYNYHKIFLYQKLPASFSIQVSGGDPNNTTAAVDITTYHATKNPLKLFPNFTHPISDKFADGQAPFTTQATINAKGIIH